MGQLTTGRRALLPIDGRRRPPNHTARSGIYGFPRGIVLRLPYRPAAPVLTRSTSVLRYRWGGGSRWILDEQEGVGSGDRTPEQVCPPRPRRRPPGDRLRGREGGLPGASALPAARLRGRGVPGLQPAGGPAHRLRELPRRHPELVGGDGPRRGLGGPPAERQRPGFLPGLPHGQRAGQPGGGRGRLRRHDVGALPRRPVRVLPRPRSEPRREPRRQPASRQHPGRRRSRDGLRRVPLGRAPTLHQPVGSVRPRHRPRQGPSLRRRLLPELPRGRSRHAEHLRRDRELRRQERRPALLDHLRGLPRPPRLGERRRPPRPDRRGQRGAPVCPVPLAAGHAGPHAAEPARAPRLPGQPGPG